MKMKNNPKLKGHLKFHNIDTLSVFDCITQTFFPLVSVEIIETHLDKWSKESCLFINPDTKEVRSSPIFWS